MYRKRKNEETDEAGEGKVLKSEDSGQTSVTSTKSPDTPKPDESKAGSDSETDPEIEVGDKEIKVEDSEKQSPQSSEIVSSSESKGQIEVRTERSQVDVLSQVFPGRNRSSLELALQEYKEDIAKGLRASSAAHRKQETAASRRNIFSGRQLHDVNGNGLLQSAFHSSAKSANSAFAPHKSAFVPTPTLSASGHYPHHQSALRSTASSMLSGIFNDSLGLHPPHHAPFSRALSASGEKELFPFPPPPLFSHMYLPQQQAAAAAAAAGFSNFLSPNPLLRPLFPLHQQRMVSEVTSERSCSLGNPCADSCDSCSLSSPSSLSQHLSSSLDACKELPSAATSGNASASPN